jgi:hypothetical protein
MRYCQKCQAPQENLRSEVCEVCGGQLSETERAAGQRPRELNAASPDITESRYPAVRTLSTICRGLAFLSILAGLIVAAAGIFASTGAGIAFSLFALLYSIGGFILLMALAEGMKIIVDIEANTRATREYLTGRLRVGG